MTNASTNSDAQTGVTVERFASRSAMLGEGMQISRALPHAHKRMVGAWCFLDHAGPAHFAPGAGMHVGPHPHIGLQTFTWMIEGEVMHRDSLGYAQVIRPGQVNLMTAGRGIAHSEDSQPDSRTLHAAQLWIALPDAVRHCPPAFTHYPVLPHTDTGGFRATVLVGEALGLQSPVAVYSPLLAIDWTSTAAANATVALRPDFEHAALCLRGKAAIGGASIEPGSLLYFGPGHAELALACDDAAQLLLVGGAPLTEDVLLWWNFVARTQAEMEAAVADWNAGQRFGAVEGAGAKPLQAPDITGLHLVAKR